MVVLLAQALQVSTDELLGTKPSKTAKPTPKEDPHTRRLWKRFQKMLELPEKDQRAVIRLINSLETAHKSRKPSAASPRH